MSDLGDQRKQEALDFLVSKFPKRFNVKNNKYVYGLLKGLSEGDGVTSLLADGVRDNLIAVTAVGDQLDRRAGRYGVIRGQGTGVQDGDFQKIIPIMGMSPKQISHTIQRLIDTIYGPYASHANVTCAAPAPYTIRPGGSLRVRCDNQQLEIFFKSTDAVNLAAASADEVATAISNHSSGQLVGSVVLNNQTGESFVNIRTSTIGSQGFVQVLGGDVQTAMRFPEIRPTRQDIATWSVSRYQGTSEILFQATSGISPGMRSAGVRTGDYVTIRMDAGFNALNCGTFRITALDDSSFRCLNPVGVPETATQQHVDDFVFYRPDMGNILLASRPATVLETGIRQLTILLPVTSPIVKRELQGGHHLHGACGNVTGTTPTEMTLSTLAGFPNAGELHVISSRPHPKSTVLSVTGANVNLNDASAWPEQGAFYAPTELAWHYYQGISGNTLQNVTPAPASTLAGTPVKYAERYTYSGINLPSQTLTGVFPDASQAFGKEVAVAGAEIIPNFPGGFLYDPEAPFITSNQSTRLNQLVAQGSSNTVIQVADTSSFDDSGYFVLEFASDVQEGPIKYLGKVGKGALMIDPGHVFQHDHLSGVELRGIRQIGPYAPRPDGSDFAIYNTSTSPARDLLTSYILDIVAAGITVQFQISVPDEKWPVLQQLYASGPTDTTTI